MTELGPAVPANWYMIGKASGLGAGSVSAHSIGGDDIVVWRGRGGGTPVAFAAHCAHMGCHLGHGEVVGERLRCGLHHRLIAADGSFARDGRSSLQQPVFPVAEYMDGLWVRIGGVAEVPDLATLGLDGFPACYAGEHRFALSWQALVANGFDVEHLASVHERRLLEPPTLEQVERGGIELRYRTRPIGTGLADRVTAVLARDGVRGEIIARNGSQMLVKGQLGRRRSFILMSFVPTAAAETTVRAIVGVERARGAWGAVQARIAARLFKAFLYKDLRVLAALEWHEPSHADTLGDGFTRQLCAYFRELPHG